MVLLISLSPCLFVALDAQLIHWRKPDEMLVLGAMRPVAACTRHGYVFVPRVSHFFAEGVARMVFPVVAGAADLDHRRLGKEKIRVRGMGVMANCAVAFLYRRMLRL